jgi:hypothetical protein
MPLCVALIASAVALVLFRLVQDQLDASVQLLTGAAVVAAALASFEDVARPYIHPVAVPSIVRRLQRLIIVLPTVVLGFAVLHALANGLFRSTAGGPGWQALAALGMVGAAFDVVLTRRFDRSGADLAAGICVGWVVAGVPMLQLDLPMWVAMPWWEAPAVVGLLALVIAVVGSLVGVEA